MATIETITVLRAFNKPLFNGYCPSIDQQVPIMLFFLGFNKHLCCYCLLICQPATFILFFIRGSMNTKYFYSLSMYQQAAIMVIGCPLVGQQTPVQEIQQEPFKVIVLLSVTI